MPANRRLLAATTIMAFVGMACSKGTTTQQAGSATPATSPASASPSPATTPPPSPSTSPALAEGRSFGAIKSVDAAGLKLVFDLEQFFTGEAADKAAQEDGVIGPGEHVDNDVYIRNVNPLLRTVPISATVSISIVRWTNCCEDRLSPNLATFAQAFPGPGPTDDFHGPNSAYWLTVKNGTIVKIEEQYLP
jgi:hypothetical protein